MDKNEEERIKRAIFMKTGVIYGFPLKKLGLSITFEEKTILEKAAARLKINIRILPKKIFVTERGVIVYDYFIDSDSCPFLKNNNCQVYEIRPKICRDFPKTKYDNRNFEIFCSQNNIIKNDYDETLLTVGDFLHSFESRYSKQSKAVS